MDTIASYLASIDPSVRTLPDGVYLLWWGVLLLVLVVIVPLAVGLLHRTLRAARSIRRYLEEMLAAGAGIAGNTASTPALKDTIAVGSGMVDSAASIERSSAGIANLLASRAGGPST